MLNETVLGNATLIKLAKEIKKLKSRE